MPLLSIIFPTRNRSQYLIDSVRLTLREIEDCEIIIADNSDDCTLGEVLEATFHDPRIKYSYSSEILSVVDNFERTIDLATGQYLLYLGDDDSIGPGLLEITHWASENNIDAIISYRNQFLCSYYWPGVKSKYFGNQYAGNVFVSNFSGKASPLDAISSLKAVANNPSGGLGSLPRAYHGIVSLDLIKKIRSQFGTLFGGVSPDIYSATLISHLASKPYLVDYPFVIPGASPSSTAGQGALRSDRGDLCSVEHIKRFGHSFEWDTRIPAFYSPHTVWPYSLLKAIERINNKKIKFSFIDVYAQCLIKDRKYYGKVRAAIANNYFGNQRTYIYIAVTSRVLWCLMKIAINLSRRMANPRAGGSAKKYSNNECISSAYDAVVDHIKNKNILLKLGKVSS